MRIVWLGKPKLRVWHKRGCTEDPVPNFAVVNVGGQRGIVVVDKANGEQQLGLGGLSSHLCFTGSERRVAVFVWSCLIPRFALLPMQSPPANNPPLLPFPLPNLHRLIFD